MLVVTETSKLSSVMNRNRNETYQANYDRLDRANFSDRPNQQRYNSYDPPEEYRNNNYRRAGCYNCGEFNHQRVNCRFKDKIQCENCLAYGHKRRLNHFLAVKKK